MESKRYGRFLDLLARTSEELSDALRDRLRELHRTRGHRGDTRLEHCVKTAYLCWRLARVLGVDELTAVRAGLLHDVGYGIRGCPLCRLDPGGHCGICHWRTGADLLAREGEGRAIVAAVRRHMFPFSPPPRTRLDWCVWWADKLEVLLTAVGRKVLPRSVLSKAVRTLLGS